MVAEYFGGGNNNTGTGVLNLTSNNISIHTLYTHQPHDRIMEIKKMPH